MAAASLEDGPTSPREAEVCFVSHARQHLPCANRQLGDSVSAALSRRGEHEHGYGSLPYLSTQVQCRSYLATWVHGTARQRGLAHVGMSLYIGHITHRISGCALGYILVLHI